MLGHKILIGNPRFGLVFWKKIQNLTQSLWHTKAARRVMREELHCSACSSESLEMLDHWQREAVLRWLGRVWAGRSRRKPGCVSLSPYLDEEKSAGFEHGISHHPVETQHRAQEGCGEWHRIQTTGPDSLGWNRGSAVCQYMCWASASFPLLKEEVRGPT